MIRNYLSLFKWQNIESEWKQYCNKMMGLTGAGTVQALSRAATFVDKNKCYLEVGIYQAVNFVGVAKTAKNTKCFGVDNFSQAFDENDLYKMTTEELVNHRIKEYNLSNAHVFKQDFREFLTNRKDINDLKVELYLFDGPHEYQDQVDGVEMAIPLLADRAIIVVDDWASENVQDSTEFLLDKYKKNLKQINLFTGPINNRDYFNQGQVVFEWKNN